MTMRRATRKELKHHCYWRELADRLNNELYDIVKMQGLKRSPSVDKAMGAKLDEYARWYRMDEAIAASRRAVLRIEYGA